MSRRVICDASALVALLLDHGPDGSWAANALAGCDLAAPSLMPCETANAIRRRELAGMISSDSAAQAHAELRDVGLELWPYSLISERTWQLRENLSAYDASYAALAELLDAPLVTLDGGLVSAPGVRCSILAP